MPFFMQCTHRNRQVTRHAMIMLPVKTDKMALLKPRIDQLK